MVRARDCKNTLCRQIVSENKRAEAELGLRSGSCCLPAAAVCFDTRFSCLAVAVRMRGCSQAACVCVFKAKRLYRNQQALTWKHLSPPASLIDLHYDWCVTRYTEGFRGGGWVWGSVGHEVLCVTGKGSSDINGKWHRVKFGGQCLVQGQEVPGIKITSLVLFVFSLLRTIREAAWSGEHEQASDVSFWQDLCRAAVCEEKDDTI